MREYLENKEEHSGVIRIAYVINYIVKNGPSSVVLNLINNLDRKKYDISLITLFSGNNPEVVACLKDKGISIYECATLSRMKCLLGQCKEFDDSFRSRGNRCCSI